MITIAPSVRLPTGADFRVLFWTGVIFLIGFGTVCLYFAYGAPPEKAEEAAKLIRGGLGSTAAGIGMTVIRRCVSGFSE